MAAAVALTATVAMAMPASHFSKQSRLSSGKWMKIMVSQTGIHAISFEQLRKWGFDNPTKVSVYGFGNAEMSGRTAFDNDLPDDICPTPTLVTNDRIIFYAEATDRLEILSYSALSYTHNIYDKYGYYFLSDCEETTPIRRSAYKHSDENNSVRTEHLSALIYQPDDHNHMNGGAYWLGPELSRENTIEYTFNIKNYKSGAGTPDYGTMGYTFVAGDESDTTSLNVVQPTNVDVPYVSNRYTQRSGSDNVYFNIAGGNARFKPTADCPLDDSRLTYGFRLHAAKKAPRFAAIKNVWIIYPRRNDISGTSQLPMTFTTTYNGQKFSITGGAKTEVWNISDPLNIFAYQTIYDNENGAITGSFDRAYSTGAAAARLIAFDPEGELYVPEASGEVPNQNIHGDETPDMAIICTSELYDAAIELAEIHRSFGNRVNVYTHQQVLNEFGSGGASPMAYKMMAKMFYDRAPGRFRHLLLYGPATWDFRGVLMPPNEYVLTFLANRERHIREASANFSTDSYFGMVSDEYNDLEIEQAATPVAVGRLNVPNSGTAHDVNAKIQQYMSRPMDPSAYARLLIMTCDGDANAHFLQGQTAADKTLTANPSFTATRAHISLYPIENGKAEFTTRKVISALNQGQGIIDYSGHGDENNLGRGNAILWQKANSANLSNSIYPIAMLSTCSAYSYDHGNNDIATSLTFKSGAGAIAAIGACRKVYMAYNNILNTAMLQSYAQAAPGATLGDIYTRARQLSISSSNGNNGAMTNALCYNLCGDPLTRIPVPDYSAYVTAIEDAASLSDGKSAASPGSAIRLHGKITDSDGRTIDTFNGSVRATIYDGPFEIIQQNPGDAAPQTIVLEEDILAENGGRVNNGEFSLDIALPEPRISGKRNRIVISALSDTPTDGSRQYSALGYTNDFVIDPEVENSATPQTAAPVIRRMYIDNSEFRSGDVIAADSIHTFHAIVEAPGTGILNSQAIIGATPRLTLDGHRDIDGICSAFTIDPNGNYHFSLPINCEFSSGKHDLRFSLTNTLGQSTTSSLNFIIPTVTYPVSIKLSHATASRQVSIDIDSPVSFSTNRLIINDNIGNTIFYAANISFPYIWHLKDNNGQDVADGPYTINILASGENGRGESKPVTLTVIKL